MLLCLTLLKRAAHFQMGKHSRAAPVLCLVLEHCKKRAFLPLQAHNCLACTVATTELCLQVRELNILLSMTTLISCFPAMLCKDHALWPLLLSAYASPVPCIRKPSHGAAAGSPRTHHQAYPGDVQKGKRVGRASPGAVGIRFSAGMWN